MIRFALAALLAVAAAQLVDELTRRRGLDPPGFRNPLRRALAGVLLTLVFLVGVSLPVVHFDQPSEVDLDSIHWSAVFFLQEILLLVLVLRWALGYARVRAPARPETGRDRADLPWNEAGFERPGIGDFKGPFEASESLPSSTRRTRSAEAGTAGWAELFGLRCRRPLDEIAVGLVAGFFAWIGVLVAAAAAGWVLTAFGGDEVLGQEPPRLIVWMAGLPVAVRLAISLSAGVVEELFFRGFLQPRIGIALSTVLFVCGHLEYGQPFMLVGLTLLSLLYALLVRWRGSIWAAMTAHFLFDAIQLLVVIPAALELYESDVLAFLLAGAAIW